MFSGKDCLVLRKYDSVTFWVRTYTKKSSQGKSSVQGQMSIKNVQCLFEVLSKSIRQSQNVSCLQRQCKFLTPSSLTRRCCHRCVSTSAHRQSVTIRLTQNENRLTAGHLVRYPLLQSATSGHDFVSVRNKSKNQRKKGKSTKDEQEVNIGTRF